MDLALNNLKRLICHKPKQPTNQLYVYIYIYIYIYINLSVKLALHLILLKIHYFPLASEHT